MKLRLFGEKTTAQNRRLAYETAPRAKRKHQVIDILKDIKQGSAMDVAEEMLNRGYIKYLDRNAAAPRLTELSIEGIVEPIGTKKDKYFNKDVTVYALTEKYLQERGFSYEKVTFQDIENNSNWNFECDADSQRVKLTKEIN